MYVPCAVLFDFVCVVEGPMCIRMSTQAIIVTEAKYKMKKAGKMFRQRDCKSGNNSVPMQRVGNVC